jgi:hypothetical protein
LPGQFDNLAVEGLAQLVAIPLDALGTGQGRRIDWPRRRQRAPQTWHFRTHRRQKCCRGVLEQVPAVGHLLGLRCSLAGGRTITWTTVAADDLNLWVLAQPGDHRVALAIGEQVDHLAALEVDHDAPVAVAAAPGEVVDANHPRRWVNPAGAGLGTS